MSSYLFFILLLYRYEDSCSKIEVCLNDHTPSLSKLLLQSFLASGVQKKKKSRTMCIANVNLD